MKKQIVNPPELWAPLGIYSHAVKVEGTRFLFLSGVTARDRHGKVVGKGDVKAQTRQVFENMKVILHSAGATFDNVIKATTFVTSTKYYQEIQEVRSEYFKSDYPASTLVQVSQLSDKDLLIEVEVVAAL